MALEEYRAKRDFTRTPEPAGDPGAVPAAGAYLIQKHAARRLHWDFRLELDGVLKSWAVTKEPTLDTGIKRLAVHTEDHPLEYGAFEGVIPKGQYGGGTVMLWDQGSWEPVGDAHKGYAKGHLSFQLHGRRLKGLFHLVRMEGEGGKNWLLIKGRDDGQIVADAPGNDVSVASGRTMEEIAAQPERVWRSDSAPDLHPEAVVRARKAGLPDRLAPMLATLADKAPDGPDWVHEIKFDGYRVLARIEGGRCRLFTRNGLDWTDKFRTIATACASLPCDAAWLDGEVVALDRHGVSRFHDLQAALSQGADATLTFHLFDCLHLNGYDLTKAGLIDRKDVLRRLLGPPADGVLRYTDHLDGRGEDFLRQACAFALEGVVSKRRDQPYRSGRSKDWLKAKCVCRQEFVVAGWTRPAGRSDGVGALLLGVSNGDGGLVSVGKVGTGFSERDAVMLVEMLTPLVCPDPPFADGTKEKGVTWVEPRLVVDVEFSDWTRDGQLRHASFQGVRLDKEATEVVREAQGREGAVEDRLAQFRLTNPERVLYPEQGLTKRALASYYLDIADWILPHVRGRALTLVRCPEGQGGNCFYQRHPRPGMSKAIRRVPDGDEVLIAVDDVEGLIGLVQMGALEIHTWGSATDDIQRPDIVVFDLDPDEGLGWNRVVDGAKALRGRLTAMGLQCFVKITGGKGLHVVVPVEPRADWDEAKAFCKRVAEGLAADEPSRYTANMTKSRRKGRIFVDYLRNQRGATFIAPYSTRSRPGAPVAVPITWGELDAGLRADHFTVETLFRRLGSLAADPWADFRAAARPLPEYP